MSGSWLGPGSSKENNTCVDPVLIVFVVTETGPQINHGFRELITVFLDYKTHQTIRCT